ncbi:MAG: membrane protein insertase YidC [Oligoflexia bacterium]|nr:membrane protein insertase YidC [Oligoflexia bacterium]
MEDKRTAIAIFLCILVVLVYSELFINPVTQEAVRQEQLRKAEAAGVTTQSSGSAQSTVPEILPAAQSTGLPTGSAAAPSTLAVPRPSEVRAGGVVVVDAPLYKAEIGLVGGRLLSFQLKNYAEVLHGKDPHDLVPLNPEDAPQELPLGLFMPGFSDTRVRYSVSGASGTSEQGSYTMLPGSELKIDLIGSLPEGLSFTKSLHFKSDSYLFDLNAAVLRNNQPLSVPLWVEWSHFTKLSLNDQRMNPETFSMLGIDGKVTKFAVDKVIENHPNFGSATWVSFGERYFISALISAGAENNSLVDKRSLRSDAALLGEQYITRIQTAPNSGQMSVYVGPKDYRILNQAGYQLHRTIDLGFFSFLGYPLLWLIRFFQEILGNYGLAIIFLTLLIKALFLPITKASFDSARAMQELQPEMKALKERIKDPNKLNQEMAALFKKRGVNPLGGCLPIFLQIPVFFGLYSALLNSIELRHAHFALWIKDLSAPEYFPVGALHIPVMMIIVGLAMFWQQFSMPQPPDPAQRRMMLIMTAVFAGMFIIFPLPSGLVLYMLVNIFMSITQQTYLRSDRKASPFAATLVAGVAIFGLGFVLTLL